MSSLEKLIFSQTCTFYVANEKAMLFTDFLVLSCQMLSGDQKLFFPFQNSLWASAGRSKVINFVLIWLLHHPVMPHKKIRAKNVENKNWKNEAGYCFTGLNTVWFHGVHIKEVIRVYSSSLDRNEITSHRWTALKACSKYQEHWLKNSVNLRCISSECWFESISVWWWHLPWLQYCVKWFFAVLLGCIQQRWQSQKGKGGNQWTKANESTCGSTPPLYLLPSFCGIHSPHAAQDKRHSIYPVLSN